MYECMSGIRHPMRVLRLVLALLALGFAMGGQAGASVAMARKSMPCHEPTRLAQFVAPATGHAHEVGYGHMPPEHDMPSLPHAGVMAAGQAVAGPDMMGHAFVPDAARLHLCCVMSLLVAPPVSAPAVAIPMPRALVLEVPVASELAGLVPAIPVPPPRRG